MTMPGTPAPRRSRRAARSQGPARGRALTVLAGIGVVLALGVAVDVFAAAEAPGPAPAVPQDPARAGSWYCPAVAGEGERAALTIAAVGDEPSLVVVNRYEGDRAVPGPPETVAPGESIVVGLRDAEAQAPTSVQWTGGPAVATWRVDGERTAAAPCEPAPSERWFVAGYNSTRGSVPTLHLFNPFTADAVVRLVFAKPDGRQVLALTENILVAAGGTTSLNLRDYQPEEPDLGVVVDVLAGRVVAQGEQTVDPPGRASGAAGRLLLPAASATSSTWSFGYAADAEGTESWLTVLNPGDDEAAVELRVSAPSQDESGFVGEVSVPPGGLSRIELAGVSREEEFGVTVNVVNDEPVVVTRSTALRTGNGTAVSGGLGAPELSRRWALVGGGTADRDGWISLYNPGPEPVRVDLLGQEAPERWQALELGPNVRKAARLSAAGTGRDSAPVVVSADAPIVAELRSAATSGAALRMWLAVGVAEGEWLGPLSRPAVRRNPNLSTRAAVAPERTEDVVPDVDPLPDVTEQAVPAGDDPS